MDEQHYRVSLRLVEVVPVTTDNQYGGRTRDDQMCSVELTGETAAEVLAQAQAHVSQLAEWYAQREREQEAAIAEAQRAFGKGD